MNRGRIRVDKYSASSSHGLGIELGCIFVLCGSPILLGFQGVYPVAAAILAVFLLAWRADVFRTLYLCIGFGMCLAWWGSQGAVAYLGVVDLSESALTYAVLFGWVLCGALAIGSSFTRSLQRRTGSSGGVIVHPGIHLALLLIAIGLLLVRLSSGIPLLQGNESRLAEVADSSPLLGIGVGAFSISSAVCCSPARGSLRAILSVLQVLLILLVLGTASRLLIVVVLLCVLLNSRSSISRFLGIREVWVTATSVVLGVVISKFVFDIRSSASNAESESVRISNVGGVGGWLNNVFGSSFYWASRNGLTVADLTLNGDLKPPGGFTFGSLLKALRVLPKGTPEPERWLTVALGFSEQSVGAVATPLWAGVRADFGFVGGLLAAVGLAFILLALDRLIPGACAWFGLALLFSFYGSYIVSLQFIFATALLLLSAWSSRRLGSSSVAVGPRQEFENA